MPWPSDATARDRRVLQRADPGARAGQGASLLPEIYDTDHELFSHPLDALRYLLVNAAASPPYDPNAVRVLGDGPLSRERPPGASRAALAGPAAHPRALLRLRQAGGAKSDAAACGLAPTPRMGDRSSRRLSREPPGIGVTVWSSAPIDSTG